MDIAPANLCLVSSVVIMHARYLEFEVSSQCALFILLCILY